MEQHAVEDADDAVGRRRFGFEDERVVAIPPADRARVPARCDPPATVLHRPEQCREARGRVEARHAEPVERAVASDERRRLVVRDERIVLDAKCHGGIRPLSTLPSAREQSTPVIARFCGSPPYCPTFGHGVPLDSVSDRRSIPAEALPDADDLHRSLFDATPVPTAVIDGDGQVLLWNTAAAGLFGWSEAELVGRPLPIVPPERRDECRATRAAVEAGRHVTALQTHRIARDGRRVDVTLSAAPLRDRHGRVTRILLVLQEMSPRASDAAALAHSEARYRCLLETTASMTWSARADGYLLESTRWTEFTGQDMDAARGNGWLNLVHPDDRPRVEATWQDLLTHPRPVEDSYRIRHRDGAYRTVVARGIPLRDDAGEVREWIGTVTDVDDAARAAAALRASEERFRRVVESNMIGICFWRDTGEITDANDALLEIVGQSRDALVAGRLDWRRIIVPEHLHRSEQALEQIRTTGLSNRYEADVTRADGTRLPILIAGASLGDPGDGVGVSWVMDISDRKRVESELLESLEVIDTVNRIGQRLAAELELEKLVQAVTDAATQITGADFGAFFYNVVAEPGESYMLYTISGVPREAFSSFPMPRNTALFDPTFRGQAPIRLDDVMADPRYGLSAPHHGMPPGHLPVRSYLAVPVVSRSGEVVGGLFFGHHERAMFSERDERVVVGLAAQAAVAIDNARLYESAQRARDGAEAASRAKDEFLSVVSHELRTPLASMTNWLRVLQNDTGRHSARAMEAIDRAARAQAKLVEDLLDVSRIVTGRLRLEPRPVDLGAVVRAALDAVMPASDAKGVRIRLDANGSTPHVAGDADRLQQVVWNLLSNAVKFTPSGGSIEVRVDHTPGEARVVVRDSGRGISAGFLPHVFERFRQEDPAATRRHGGLGLGLAIVRHLVELHGGTVAAASAGEGQGATFTVTLPTPDTQDISA
jgi:PAS domain S-box-containing protein